VAVKRPGTEPSDRLLLLDTASIYFRAYHAIPDSITAPDGTPVNAVRGLIDVVARLIRERRPTRLVACMDADWRPAWRVAAVPAYKAHRIDESTPTGETMPDTLTPQVPIIEDVLAAAGIAMVGVANYEADDIIGTLATAATCPVDIVTGDRDLFQLVRDDIPVRVIYTVKGIGELANVDEAEVARRYSIPPRSYAEFALLRGDPSDGLPGVPGIGEKTAAALLKAFGSIEAMLAAVDAGGLDKRLPKGSAAKLAAGRDYIAAAEPVVRVATGVRLPKYNDRLPDRPKHPKKLVGLAEKWSIESPVTRLTTSLAGEAATAG
jgi:5'-3' exonuclease